MRLAIPAAARRTAPLAITAAGVRRGRLATPVALAGALLVAATPTHAADPGRWRLSATDALPASYDRGLAPDGAGALFWAGSDGLYRGDLRLVERLHLDPAIPGFARSADGLTAIGEPSWDGARERLLVPLACRASGCPAGAIALYDRALLWRGRALLDRAEIGAPGWAELDPGGALVWTSSGRDLLAYRVADVASAVATTGAAPIRAARRVPGVVPAGEVRGAAFSAGRLLLAVDGDAQQVWSLDVREGAPADARLEIERPRAARVAGLAAIDARGGLLQLALAPASGARRGALLSFVPASDAALTLRVSGPRLGAGRPATLEVRVTQAFAGRTRAVSGALVRAGRWSARTDAFGNAELRVRPPRAGALEVRATKAELTADATSLPVAVAIGGALTGLPRARVSAGAASVTLRAVRLLDCSGTDGCEAIGRPAPRGCLALGSGDLRVRLLRRPPRDVSVLLLGPGGSRRVSGLAQPSGRQGLGWRLRLGGARGGTGRLELLMVYPDGTGALFVARTRPGRC